MKVGPPKRQNHRPAAIVIPGNRRMEVLTVDGSKTVTTGRKCAEAFAGLGGHVVFVLDQLQTVTQTTGATAWKCHLWKGRPTRMIHQQSGTVVTSLRGTLEGTDDAWRDLSMVLDWLATYDVPTGSIPAMAWSLFRSSLPETYTIGFDPVISGQALFGGRQEMRGGPRTYQNARSYDVKSAYPVAMASRDYALSLREIHVKSRLDPDASGLAEASIFVPHDLPFAPMPTRLAPGFVSFQHGRVDGIWPWCEVAAAKAIGCDVKIRRLWGPARTADLFGAWWPMVAEGRDLPGPAGVLAKAISNSTWGQFGMKAEARAVRYFTDDSGNGFYEVPEPDHGLPHEWTAHIAAETTARIRTKMLLEGLYGLCSPVYVDTDGIIIEDGSPLPTGVGPRPGDWRLKATMPVCDIRGPQFLRWTCGAGCGDSHAEWHYSCAGVSIEDAPAYFAQNRSGDIDVSWVRSFATDTESNELQRVALMGRQSLIQDRW